MEKWAIKIKCRLLQSNIRQSDLADKLNITKSYLTMLLRGDRKSPNIGFNEMNRAIDEIIKERKV